MAGNLPSGCTDADVDRAMGADDPPASGPECCVCGDDVGVFEANNGRFYCSRACEDRDAPGDETYEGARGLNDVTGRY
jgi:hypothetical protein